MSAMREVTVRFDKIDFQINRDHTWVYRAPLKSNPRAEKQGQWQPLLAPAPPPAVFALRAGTVLAPARVHARAPLRMAVARC